MRNENTQKGSGTTIAIVIILIVLLIGAIYFLKNSSSKQIDNANQAVENEIPSDTSLTQTEATLKTQGSADDINSIDADLKATSFDSL